MINLTNIFIPLLSPVISIILFLGLFFIGKIFLRFLNLDSIIKQVSNPLFQYPLVGSIFLTFLLFPLVIFNLFDNFILLKTISIILLISGLFFLIKNFPQKNYTYFKKRNLNTEIILFVLFFLGYFLLSLGPITNADSLDYHIGVPLNIVNTGEYPAFKFWIHFNKSGSGEILNTLGLFLKAEQFPSLIQYSGILSIGGLLLKKINKQKNFSVFLLIFLSCPVLIFLISSAKVQLNFVASSCLIFSLVFFGNKKNLTNFNFLLFLNIFLMSAVNAKFSFALSSFLIWTYIFYFCLKYKNLKSFIFSTALVFIFTLLPRIIWRMDVYELDIIQSLLSPIPTNIYGYKQLYDSVASCGYHGCLPYWLVFPKSLNEITEALGFGSLIILFISLNKKNFPYLPISLFLIQIILSKIFGQNNARWFLEPMIWGTLIVKYYRPRESFIFKIYSKVIILQSIVILGIIYYGVVTISIGSLSFELRDKVMTKTANGYNLFKWSNSKLKPDDVVISTHRSFALSNTKTIPGDLFNYIEISSPKAINHYNEIKNLKPTHILFYDNKKNYNKFEKCLGKLLFFKIDAGKISSRNPFNRNQKTYPGFIYEFDYKKLPYCLIDKSAN